MKRYLLYISIISLGSLLFTQPLTPTVTADTSKPVVKTKSRPVEPKSTPKVETAPVPSPVASATPSPAPIPQPTPAIPTDHAALAAAAGISAGDFGYVDYILTHESGWRYWATNGSSGAYGLCQSLPGGKMASAGDDWQTNPVTQLKWCNSYAISRYGGWYGAYVFWINHHWW